MLKRVQHDKRDNIQKIRLKGEGKENQEGIRKGK